MDAKFSASSNAKITLDAFYCKDGAKFTLSIKLTLLNVSDLYDIKPSTDKSGGIRSEMSFDPEDPFMIDYGNIKTQISNHRSDTKGDTYSDLTITVPITRIGNQDDVGGRLFMHLVGRGPKDEIRSPDPVVSEGTIKFSCEK